LQVFRIDRAEKVGGVSAYSENLLIYRWDALDASLVKFPGDPTLAEVFVHKIYIISHSLFHFPHFLTYTHTLMRMRAHIHAHAHTHTHTHALTRTHTHTTKIRVRTLTYLRTHPHTHEHTHTTYVYQALCDVYLKGMKQAKTAAEGLLPALLTSLVNIYRGTRSAKCLEVAGTAVEIYGHNPATRNTFQMLLQEMNAVSFEVVQAQGLEAQPEILEAHFTMLTRYLIYSPEAILTSPGLPTVLQLAIAGVYVYVCVCVSVSAYACASACASTSASAHSAPTGNSRCACLCLCLCLCLIVYLCLYLLLCLCMPRVLQLVIAGTSTACLSLYQSSLRCPQPPHHIYFHDFWLVSAP